MGSLDGWRFCPRCRQALEHQPGRVSCPACGFVAYANPSVSACALCEDDAGRVLLARRAHDPFAGLWDIPGGFIEEGEHPLDALRRELREETGLEVEPVELLGVWPDVYGTGPEAGFTINLYWTARVLSGDPEPADDVSELAWFPPDALPDNDELAFENVPLVLAAWVARGRRLDR